MERYCLDCGEVVDRDDQFCYYCGEELPVDGLEHEGSDPGEQTLKDGESTHGERSPPAVTDGDAGDSSRRYCLDCGRPAAVGDTFCYFCGERLPVTPGTDASETEQTHRQCPDCGEAVHPDDLFCYYCGERLGEHTT